MLLLLREISERKRHERQRARSELQYRTMFEESPVGLAHTTLAGRWARCNARLLESVLVQKSYSPDMPGDFGGGIVAMRTKNYPEEFTLSMLLGADLPGNLMPPREDNNETGFWESQDVCQLNDAILARLGSR
mgnify:CR=1 FL=1